jgi:hypothetical protein
MQRFGFVKSGTQVLSGTPVILICCAPIFRLAGICGLVFLCSLGCSNRQELNWADYYKSPNPPTKSAVQAPPGSFGSGAMPYGSGAMPYGSGAMPYGSGAMPYGSGAMPYGSGAMPYGSGAMPYGSGAMPYGSGAPSFGTGVSFGPSRMISVPRTNSVGQFPKFGTPYPTN